MAPADTALSHPFSPNTLLEKVGTLDADSEFPSCLPKSHYPLLTPISSAFSFFLFSQLFEAQSTTI